ncbi:DUF6894 family protein [Bradyrhizobium jicamae]|uniref:DUF6894 family protein n=1 Tax=Bradyrhizobium jicamae TaxID=280332 RepID=UPI00390C8E75
MAENSGQPFGPSATGTNCIALRTGILVPTVAEKLKARLTRIFSTSGIGADLYPDEEGLELKNLPDARVEAATSLIDLARNTDRRAGHCD